MPNSGNEPITCYTCDEEAVALIHKGVKERPVCETHLEKLREVGLDV